jgi:hypothetical protein
LQRFPLIVGVNNSTGKNPHGKGNQISKKKADPNKKAGKFGQSAKKNKPKSKANLRILGRGKALIASRRKAVNRNKGSKAKKR